MNIQVSCHINGRPVSFECLPQQRLLSVLRDTLGMTGTKTGCESGSCGACTVHLDEQPVCACLVLAAEVQGKRLTTIEGLSDETALHPLQVALGTRQVLSCGACGPGVLMAAAALWQKNPQVDAAAVAHALAGNLCACSRYPQIVSAIVSAVDALDDSGTIQPALMTQAALARVTGAAGCQAELRADGAFYGAILRSPFSHARVLRLDLARAQAIDGVKAVISATNGSDLCGHLLARDKVRYQGHPVALVAAVDTETAKRALAEITVEYAILPSVTSVRQAMEPDAPLLDEALYTQGIDPVPAHPSNIANRETARRGQPDKAFASAEVMLGDEIEFAPVLVGGFEQAVSTALGATESESAVTFPEDDSSPAARSLAEQVLPLAEALSVQSGQSVSIRSGPTELPALTPAHFATFRLGARRDGTLLAVEGVFCCQTGAYPASLAAQVCTLAFADYQVPNQNLIAYDIIANTPPLAAPTASAAMCALLVTEIAMDALARKLNMDPLELRLRNAVDRTSLLMAAGHEHSVQPVDVKNGRGVACAMGSTHLCDIELDALSGQVRVSRYTVFADVEGADSDQSCAVFQQALSEAFRQMLNEPAIFDENGCLHDVSVMHYRISAVLDLPVVEVVCLAGSDKKQQSVPGASAFHDSGIATAVAAAAIANAVASAVGGSLREFPINPASIHKALKRAALRRR